LAIINYLLPAIKCPKIENVTVLEPNRYWEPPYHFNFVTLRVHFGTHPHPPWIFFPLLGDRLLMWISLLPKIFNRSPKAQERHPAITIWPHDGSDSFCLLAWLCVNKLLTFYCFWISAHTGNINFPVAHLGVVLDTRRI